MVFNPFDLNKNENIRYKLIPLEMPIIILERGLINKGSIKLSKKAINIVEKHLF